MKPTPIIVCRREWRRGRDSRQYRSVGAAIRRARQQREAATLGMWVFLCTEILFFGVLFASYTVLRVLHPLGFAIASRQTDMLLGTVETAVLLTSSSLIALACTRGKLNQWRAAMWLMAGTASLGVASLSCMALNTTRSTPSI